MTVADQAGGAVADAVSVPLVPAGLLGDVIGNFQAYIRGIIKWFAYNVTQAILDLMSRFATMGFERFLFYPNPADVPILDEIWRVSLGAFFVIVAISVLYRLLMAQFFPKTNDGDLQVYLERVAKYLVIIFVSRELLALATEATHLFAAAFYRTGIDFSAGAGSLRVLVNQFGVFKASLYVSIFGVVLWIAGTGLIIIFIARMFVIYLTYSLLPLLMGFQVVDIGPWSQIHDLGEKFIKTSLKLMVFGVLVTAFLWVSYAALGVDASGSGNLGGTATGSVMGPINSFMMYVSPLIMINYVGLKLLLEVTG